MVRITKWLLAVVFHNKSSSECKTFTMFCPQHTNLRPLSCESVILIKPETINLRTYS